MYLGGHIFVDDVPVTRREKVVEEAEELLNIGEKLNIKIELLMDDDAEEFINRTLNRFKPFKISGHLGIGNSSFKLPIDTLEFSYMKYLREECGYIFWGQESRQRKKTVVRIKNIRLLGKILENSFGMEYFLTNEKVDFLIAVNWYVIEFTGTAKDYLEKLKDKFIVPDLMGEK